MSRELDEKAVMCGGCGAIDPQQRCIGCLHDFYPNRLAASPSPSGVEVVVIDATDRDMIARGDRIGAKLVRQLLASHDQAQSALAAMRAERDEAKENASALRSLLEYSEDSIARLQSKWQFQLERADTAEAQVLRLTEEIEALRKERTSLIETKREQIERLAAEAQREAWSRIAADARIKALEEALRPFAEEAEQWEGFEDSETLVEGWSGGPSSLVNVASLRAARLALKENTL